MELIRFSLQARESVFESMEMATGRDLFALMRPDWKAVQRDLIESLCVDVSKDVWVAEVDGAVAGFVATQTDNDTKIGQIYMVAVDPQQQNRGVGTALSNFAFEHLRGAGMAFVEVHTGNDPSHAAARRSYERLASRR